RRGASDNTGARPRRDGQCPHFGRGHRRSRAAGARGTLLLNMEAARALYTTLGSAALPLLPLRLWWRGRKEPGYRRQISERFGRYRGNVTSPVYWIHAVSVGETRAATPLVQRLAMAYPGATLLLTHMTAAGRETG